MDFYPNSIDENSLERKKFDREILETIRNEDVINETIKWFNEVIEANEKIDSIWADQNISPEEVKIQILAKKELCALLTMKRDEFVSDLEMAKDYKEKQANGSK